MTLSAPPRGESAKKIELVDVPVVHTFYELYLSWTAIQARFPKSKRYSLGVKCDSVLIDAMAAILQAAHSGVPEKIAHLERGSVNVDVAKILIRTAKDSRCLTNEEYLCLQSRLQEIGKAVGSWLKNTQDRNAAGQGGIPDS